MRIRPASENASRPIIKPPPEEQVHVRKSIKFFRDLPTERRKHLREKWAAMSTEERRALRQRL
ncbi:MAG: DUF3106 domain-containing protein [Candidatus Thiodiazotropha endolucinida]